MVRTQLQTIINDNKFYIDSKNQTIPTLPGYRPKPMKQDEYSTYERTNVSRKTHLSEKDKHEIIQKELFHAEKKWNMFREWSKKSTYKLSLDFDALNEKKIRAEKTLNTTRDVLLKKINIIKYSGEKDCLSIAARYQNVVSLKYDHKRLSLVLNLIQELERCIHSSTRGKKHSDDQLKFLSEWWYKNLNHPYPSKKDVADLCSKTGLSSSQVRNFFQNKRSRNGIRRLKKKVLC